MAEWRLTFIGTGSLFSHAYRGFPATLLEAPGLRLLVDCGDGTYGRLRSSGSLALDAVAITSNSVPELSGLITLAEMHRRSRKRPLVVFGPRGFLRALEQVSACSDMRTAELFEVAELGADRAVLSTGGTHVEAVSVDVGDGASACAYLVHESPLPGRMDAAKATALGIKGADFALLQQGQIVRGVRPSDVIGPVRRGRRVVVAGRGRSSSPLVAALQRSDVAVLAAPFMDERLEAAEDSYYFTGWEAAELARRSKVHTVVLQRLGAFAPARQHVEEARQFHDRLLAPKDGDVMLVPLPESGRGPHFEQQQPAPPRAGGQRSERRGSAGGHVTGRRPATSG